MNTEALSVDEIAGALAVARVELALWLADASAGPALVSVFRRRVDDWSARLRAARAARAVRLGLACRPACSLF